MLPLAALIVAVGLETGTQSLADVARKTEEQRKQSPTPAAKVITNDDLKPGRMPADAPHADANTSAEILKKQTDAAKSADSKAADAKAAETPAAPPSGEKGEAYWRGRWTPLHDKLVADEAKRADVNERSRAVMARVAALPPGDERDSARDDMRSLANESRAIQSAVAADLAALDALEAEGRKAGAPVAWFR